MSRVEHRYIQLASASPRRKELFLLTGWDLVVSPVDVDEVTSEGETPEEYAKRLAMEKGTAQVARGFTSDIILAADTIVVNGGHILGKPVDEAHARQILYNLRGKSHRVLTALALIDQEQNNQLIDICETVVPMRNYSDVEVEAYIASGDPMDKAGAYGIQNTIFHPVAIEEMVGCYTNVMGLPLCHLARSMRELGMEPTNDIPQQCKLATRFNCQVYEEILGC